MGPEMTSTIELKRAASIDELLAEFERQNIHADQTEIVLSIAEFKLPGAQSVWLGGAKAELGSDASVSIPLVAFRRFEATMFDDTAFLATDVAVLQGARINRDGSVELTAQPSWPTGITIKGVRFPKVRINYHWSEFDSYVMELVAKKMGLAERVIKTIEHRGFPEPALDLSEIARMKASNLKTLIRSVEKQLQLLLDSNAFAKEGLKNLKAWQGRSDMRNAIANTFKRSGIRDSRESGTGANWRA